MKNDPTTKPVKKSKPPAKPIKRDVPKETRMMATRGKGLSYETK